MITPVWIIGFTGHRPKNAPGRTSAELEHLASTIRQELLALKTKAEAQQGRAEFLCGVAAGADIIAAREAEALGMPVHVILPMPLAYFKEDFKDDALQADLEHARRFIDLAQKGKGGATFRIAHGSQLRDDCYYDVGSQIVYASDAIIALWDGVEPQEIQIQDATGKRISPDRGGTADVIALAEADRMPFLKRKKPAEGYRWLSTPVRCIHSAKGEVTGDISNFASPTDAGLAEMKALQHAADVEHGTEKRISSAKELMDFVDHKATDWAKWLRTALLCGIGFHFIASLTAAVSAASQKAFVGIWTPSVLASVELAFVLIAIGIAIWAHGKHVQARWLELRLATELARGLFAAGRLSDPLFPIATDHLPGWRRYCLSVGLSIWRDAHGTFSSAATPEDCFAKEKQDYLEKRIEDQLQHFEKNDPKVRYRWHHLANLASPILSVAAVIAIVNALIHKVHDAKSLLAEKPLPDATLAATLLYLFLPIALPLLAGAVASLQSVTDVKRRAQVYPEMVERLKSARDFLPAIRTPASLRRFVRRTEEILLDELVGWYAAAKGISH